MLLWIQINPGSAEAIYLQVVRQVAQAIAKGQILPGDKLPPVRKLAQELVVNPNTIAKAYLTLEQQKLVVTKKGSGTFISNTVGGSTEAPEMNVLNERIDNVLAHCVNSGMTTEQILNLFESRLKQFETKANGETNE